MDMLAFTMNFMMYPVPPKMSIFSMSSLCFALFDQYAFGFDFNLFELRLCFIGIVSCRNRQMEIVCNGDVGLVELCLFCFFMKFPRQGPIIHRLPLKIMRVLLSLGLKNCLFGIMVSFVLCIFIGVVCYNSLTSDRHTIWISTLSRKTSYMLYGCHRI